MKSLILIFLRGLAMGMADIIPGVSGGTIALITGIYERLIFAIRGLSMGFLKKLLKGDAKGAAADIKTMDLEFLAALFAGIITSFLVLSGVIRFFMNVYPSNTYAFFFGLILASAVFVRRHVERINWKTAASGISGLVFAILLVGSGTLQSSHIPAVIFFSGFIAICAMILPGISGAFILFFLGQYEYMLNALHSLDVFNISVFSTGAVLGLLTMSRVLGYLLKNHKAATMSFLVGLMLGALRMPYENIVTTSFVLPFVMLSAISGFVVVVMLEKLSGESGSNSS